MHRSTLRAGFADRTRRGAGWGIALVGITALGLVIASLAGLAQSGPLLSGVEPGRVVNDSAWLLTLRGSEFTHPPTVTIGMALIPGVHFVSSTTLTATLPAGFQAGVWDVSVTISGGLSSTLPAALVVENPAPVVTSISPTRALNDQDTPLAIHGSGFVPTPTVSVNAIALDQVEWLSPTLLNAGLPWGLDPGVYDLSVTNPGPGDPTSGLARAVTVTQALGVWNSGGPYGGIVDGIWIDPQNPQTVYGLIPFVGVFRSLDGGGQWSQLPVGSAGFDMAHSNPLVLYSAYYSLYRSTDGGDTWTNRPTPASFDFVHVDPEDEYHLLAGGTDRSTIGYLFTSTDGGNTWITSTSGLTDTIIADIAFDPLDTHTVYLVTYNGRLFRSQDDGASWQIQAEFAAHTTELVAVNPHPPYDIWVGSTETNRSGMYGAIFRASRDDLTQWEQPVVSVAIYGGANALAFDPQIPGTLYLALRAEVLKSTDGGATWQWGLLYYPQSIAVAPDASHSLYAGVSSLGMRKSSDHGATWAVANQGLSGIVPSSMAVVDGRPDEVYTTVNPFGLYWTENGGRVWKTLSETSGAIQVDTDPFMDGRAYLGVYDGLVILEDHGLQETKVHPAAGVPGWCGGCTLPGGVMAVSADPSIAGRLLASVGFGQSPVQYPLPGGLYESLDYGLTWHEVVSYTLHLSLDQITFSPSDAQIVYASGYAGAIRSGDGGFTWETISPPVLADRRMMSIAVHPQNPQIIAVSGFGAEGGVHISRDGGQTWQQGLLPGAHWVLFTPSGPVSLVYGSSEGLFRSTDLGATWQRAAGSLGITPVTALAAGTDGSRQVLYVALAGQSPQAGTAGRQPAAGDDPAAPGVYRQVERVHNFHLYLPFAVP